MRAIIGFDPGVTSGLAVINLSGEVQFLGSFRDTRPEDIAKKVIEIAIPLVVAGDVYPAPGSVSDLARLLGAVLFSPTISLTVQEKQTLTANHTLGDVHQRDALAAALTAYRAYRPVIERAKQKTGLKYEFVFEKLLKGKASKIADAIREKVELPSSHKDKNLLRRFEVLKVAHQRLQNDVGFLSRENIDLKLQLDRMREALADARSVTYSRISMDSMVKKLRSQVSVLTKNQGSLIKRVKHFESVVESLSTWFDLHRGRLIRVNTEGEGFRFGGFVLREDPKEQLGRIISEHRKSNKR